MARTSLWIRKLSGSQYVVADDKLTTGNIYWVSSVIGTNSSGLGVTPDAPLASLAYALANYGTANNYDRFYLMPGHAESISAAGGITAGNAGVEIIGMGLGSNKATLSFANTAATIAVTAANVTFRNIRVTSTVDEMVKMFNISAPGCTLDGVDHFETTSCQTIQFAFTTTAADDLTIQNCRHYQATAAGSAQKWIELIGADRARIVDNTFILAMNNAATTATITSTGTAPVGIEIARNTIVQTGGTTQVSAILLMAATSGHVHDNRVAAGVTTLAGTVALASCYGAENYVSHTVNKNGILDPGVDS